MAIGNQGNQFVKCSETQTEITIETDGSWRSNAGCSGTDVSVESWSKVFEYSGGVDPFTDIYVDYNGCTDLTCQPKLVIKWNSNFSGKVQINIKSIRHPQVIAIGGCPGQPGPSMTFYVEKEGNRQLNPTFSLSSTDVIANTDVTFTWAKPTGDNSVYYVAFATQINGAKDDYQLTYPTLTQTFKAPSTPGTYTYNTSFYNSCNAVIASPTFGIVSHANCYQDGSPSLAISGPNLQTLNSGWGNTNGAYIVEKSTTAVPKVYSFTISNITDFANNYSISVDDPTNVIVSLVSGTTYNVEVKDAVANHIISFNGVYGECRSIAPLNLFVGADAGTLNITSQCLIRFPQDLPTYFPKISSGPPIDWTDYALKNFNYVVNSDIGVIIQDGVVLKDGAHITVTPAPVFNDGTTVDNTYNWFQRTEYSDDNNVLSQSRIYFDEAFQPIQRQIKNLAGKVILASDILYDDLGRPAVQTLTAPVRGDTRAVGTNSCGNSILTGQDMYFEYSSGFSGGYDDSDFAGSAKEDNPNAMISTTKGTVGWYYSASNDYTKVEGEKFVATTSYPYNRLLYYNDGSNDIKGATLPGDHHVAGGGHIVAQEWEKIADLSVTTPVLDTDDNAILTNYLSVYNTINGTSAVVSSYIGNVTKRSVKDTEGSETIEYSDRNGNTIIIRHVNSGHQSFNYYDTQGRLISSLSPNAVDGLFPKKGAASTTYSTCDKTTYKYNHRGLVVEKTNNDEGTTQYIYRNDGLLRFSQNSKQSALSTTLAPFSYVQYDQKGRAIEMGLFTPSSGSTYTFGSTDLYGKSLELDGTNTNLSSGGTKSDVIKAVYDVTVPVQSNQLGVVLEFNYDQQFTQGRLSYLERGNAQSWFSYDDRGRIVWLAHSLPSLGIKVTQYKYNYQGQVSEMAYQREKSDAFYHYYEYDADGRMIQAYAGTSEPTYDQTGLITNKSSLQEIAQYGYYKHGPLKRTELGNTLQGIDYLYTAQGWLKSINNYQKANDPGNDASGTLSEDLFGMTLDYFSGDFSAPSCTVNAITGTDITAEHFNGLIRSQSWFSKQTNSFPVSYTYTYDDKYQFKSAVFGNIVANGFTKDIDKQWNESISEYDPNGNIKDLKRYQNKVHVKVDPPGSDYDKVDVQDFSSYAISANGNRVTDITNYASYTYSANGEIKSVTDKSGTTYYYKYDSYGMLLGVYTDAAFTPTNAKAIYSYDALGNKYKKDDKSFTTAVTTIYVHDLEGRPMGVYDNNNNSSSLEFIEAPIYGLNGIGQFLPQTNKYVYELADHLGNVRVLFEDDGTGKAEVVGYTDYYPFGLEMPGRIQAPSSTYRYGYQGGYSEREKGSGVDWNSFLLRNYDPNIGRWLGVDPYSENHSSYLAMGNNPLSFVDPDGGQQKNGQNQKQNDDDKKVNDKNKSQTTGLKYPWDDEKPDNTGTPNINSINNSAQISTNGFSGGGNYDNSIGAKTSNDEEGRLRSEEILKIESSEQDNNYNFFHYGRIKDRYFRMSTEISDGGANENTIVINAHGNDKEIHGPFPKRYLTPEELHYYLLQNNATYRKSVVNGYKITVRLEACNTGNGFAKEFSRLNVNMNVVAPSNKITNILIWVQWIDNNGVYLKFNNGSIIK